MNTKKQLFFFFILITTLISPLIVSGQDEEVIINPNQVLYHNKGDMAFSIGVGANFPLFFQSLAPGSDNSLDTDQHLTYGGLFTISWDFYLSKVLRAGITVQPSFLYTVNENLLYLIPVTARITYEYQPVRDVSIPLIFGIGPSFNTFEEDFHIDIVLQAGTGFFWNMDVEWSFGLTGIFWWTPQIYENSDYNVALGNLEISVSAIYHF